MADEVARPLTDLRGPAGELACEHKGDAAAQIVGFAALSRPADLIVLGTRRRTGLRRAVLGSVGRTVLTPGTDASVLVVKTRIEGDAPPSADD